MSAPIGSRVGAIQKGNIETVYLYGYGVYEGVHTMPEHFPGERYSLSQRIRLDNGDVVWGFECWWDTEDFVKKMIGDSHVVMVDINKEREARIVAEVMRYVKMG